MREEQLTYDVHPKVVRAGRVATLTIKSLYDHGRFVPGTEYRVLVRPSLEIANEEVTQQQLQTIDGALQITYPFLAEQEYTIRVELSTGERRGDSRRTVEFRVYALAADLFDLRPWKGDFHMHSHRSDGKESPAYVAACCRRIGLDAMAITDHHRYEPSLEAIRAFAGLPIDLRIYPGEEVHPPANRVHMINFGGSFSVNTLFADELAYRAEVRAIEDTLTGFSSAALRYQYASCVWTYNKIRAGGGLSIFCHPYWIESNRYNVPEELMARHFSEQPYDAYEVIGGYHLFEVESNLLQVARYNEERANGRRIPIVGVSDAHGCENGALFGWYCTIAFAPSPDLPDLIGAIKDLRSVAVEALPDQTPRAYGPLRLVLYAQFLLREVFPQHDALCAIEGQLMLAHAAGDPTAAEQLQLRQGRVTALYEQLWAK